MRRRQFIAGSLAALAFPHALFAAGAAYDPTPQMVSIKPQYAVGELLILPRSLQLWQWRLVAGRFLFIVITTSLLLINQLSGVLP